MKSPGIHGHPDLQNIFIFILTTISLPRLIWCVVKCASPLFPRRGTPQKVQILCSGVFYVRQQFRRPRLFVRFHLCVWRSLPPSPATLAKQSSRCRRADHFTYQPPLFVSQSLVTGRLPQKTKRPPRFPRAGVASHPGSASTRTLPMRLSSSPRRLPPPCPFLSSLSS